MQGWTLSEGHTTGAASERGGGRLTRRYVPSPVRVQEDLKRTRATLRQIDAAFVDLADVLEELHDAAHRPGSGDGIAPGRNRFTVSDPTGDIASSGMHAYMRRKAREVELQLRQAMKRVRWAEDYLTESRRLLQEGFAAFDPEHRQRLARLREIEEADRKDPPIQGPSELVRGAPVR